MIKQYECVQLKSGNKATIVEILEAGVAYIADVERDGYIYTEFIKEGDILTGNQ